MSEEYIEWQCGESLYEIRVDIKWCEDFYGDGKPCIFYDVDKLEVLDRDTIDEDKYILIDEASNKELYKRAEEYALEYLLDRSHDGNE